MKWIECVEEKAFFLTGARLLQIGAGVVLLFRALTELPFAGFLNDITTIPAQFRETTAIGLLIIWLFAGLGLIFGKWTRLASLGGLAVYVMAEPFSITSDGGDNILRLVLLYMVFMLEPEQLKKAKGVSIFLHNVAVVATLLQICVLYIISGSAKLQGHSWVNGTALYYVLHVDAYGVNWVWLRDLIKQPLVVAGLTYTTIVYQIGFVFMLTSRYHVFWVLLGVGFHLGILVCMGLTTFSLIMISLGLFTVRDSEWRMIGSWLQATAPKLWKQRWNGLSRWLDNQPRGVAGD